MPAKNPQPEQEYEEEPLDSDIEDNEGLLEDGEFDEIDDEGEIPDGEEPLEGEDEEPAEDDTDEDGEPTAIFIPWKDEDGTEKELEIGLDEIPGLVEYAEYGRAMAEHSQQAEKYFEENKTFVTIGKGVIQDPFLNSIVTWRAQGYSEQDIVKSLQINYGQMENTLNPTSIDEDFPDVDENAKAYLQKQLDKRLSPLQDQLSREQSERQAQQNIARNNEVISSALYEEQIVSLTPQESAVFTSTFREIYPGYDTHKDILTPRQIKTVLRESGISAARAKQAAPATPRVALKPRTAPLTAAKKAPPIAPGKTGTQAMRKSVSTANTREAKSERLRTAGIF